MSAHWSFRARQFDGLRTASRNPSNFDSLQQTVLFQPTVVKQLRGRRSFPRIPLHGAPQEVEELWV
jgi:hypothetical protein